MAKPQGPQDGFDMGQDFLNFVQQNGNQQPTATQDPNLNEPPGPGNRLTTDNHGTETGKDRQGPNTPGITGNPDAPRMPTPQPPSTITPPSPEAGNPTSAQPPAPTAPTPAPPMPYNPLPPPSPEDLVMSPLGRGTLSGSAGGLLGGGLGTTGNVEEGKGDSLLPLLMKLLQQQGQ